MCTFYNYRQLITKYSATLDTIHAIFYAQNWNIIIATTINNKQQLGSSKNVYV